MSSGSCFVYFLHNPLFFFHEEIHSILYLYLIIFKAFKSAESLLARRQSCACPLRINIESAGVWEIFASPVEVLAILRGKLIMILHVGGRDCIVFLVGMPLAK